MFRLSTVTRWLSSITILLLLVGCNNNASYVLRSENVLPEDFYKISLSPERGYPEFLVMKATDQPTFIELWNFYNFSGEVANFDFDENGALFIGTYESSCESVVSSVKDIQNDIVLDIDTEMGTGGCAEIANPRSFIVEWGKSDLKEQNHVVFSEGHEGIKVPFKELEEINKALSKEPE